MTNSEKYPAVSEESLQQALRSECLAELLGTVGADLGNVPHVDGCTITLLQDSGTALITSYIKLPADFSAIEASYLGFHFHLDQPDVNTQVFKNGKPELVCKNDLGKYAESTGIRFERWKMHSLLVLPLSVTLNDGQVKKLGTIAVFSQSQILDSSQTQLIEKIAEVYAPLIRIHWRYRQADARGTMVEAMYAEIQQFIAYITRINSLGSLEAVYASIGNEYIERFGFDMVNILLEKEGELEMVHTAYSKPYWRLSAKWEPHRKKTKYLLNVRDGQSGMVFLNNHPFLITDVQTIVHLPMSEKDKAAVDLFESLRTFMIVPISLNDDVIGVMWLGTLGEPVELPESTLVLIDLLTSFVSTAISNAQAHKLVARQNTEIDLLNKDLRSKMSLLDQVARKDHLTGLNNYGNFEEELKRRTAEYSRLGQAGSLSMILFDIDHFKQFNDAHGHPAGNVILREIGARITKCVRDMDFVARYGGEEFAVLLPQCDLSGATMIAERIRRKIAEEVFMVDGKSHVVTLSGGCARWVLQESPHDFVCRVDAALYVAKNKGRNRIEKSLDNAGEVLG